jgi:hypothetical protein
VILLIGFTAGIFVLVVACGAFWLERRFSRKPRLRVLRGGK